MAHIAKDISMLHGPIQRGICIKSLLTSPTSTGLEISNGLKTCFDGQRPSPRWFYLGLI